MRSTLWPSSASAGPRLTAGVVFRAPPFCIAAGIVRAKIDASLTEPRKTDNSDPIYRMAPGLFIDIAIGVLILIALFLGYQRGVIQPLMAEIFFFGTLLLVFRFHDQYTTQMEKIVHLNAV